VLRPLAMLGRELMPDTIATTTDVGTAVLSTI
jgi:hypothetical protein